jgi:acid phosphatase type 7
MKLKSLLLALTLCASAVAQDKIIGGPYVVNATGRSATISWVVESGQVKVGTDPEKLERTAPVLRTERVTLTGLTAGEMVHYDVLNGRAEGKGRFRTPPPAGTETTFEAMIFGDTRTRHDMHQKVIDAVLKYADPHLSIHTGDLVADGADTAQWPIFFEVEKELMRRAAYYPVLGNHERNNYKYYDFFEVTSPYYSFDWGQVHFTVLNTDLGNFSLSTAERERFWDEQRRWLIDDLRRAEKAQFRVVVMHHPPFTGVARRQGSGGNVLARTLVPVFEQHKVHFVFSGHDHNYQHHEFGGVKYIVTGGGGAPLYPVDGPIEGITKKLVSTEHFVRLLISPGLAKVQAVATDGTVLDSFEVEP